MSVLIDTNIFVDALRAREEAMGYLAGLSHQPATSVICAAELIAGADRQREEHAILALLSRMTILPATLEIGLRASSFVRHYGSSHNVGLADAMIAATAEHHGLQLATLNVKHFPMFKRLKPAY